jgi:hypothetical protein
MGAPRPMSDAEIKSLLASDVVGHLATIDGDGYPHVTSLWFRWDGEVARMTSVAGKPHLVRLSSNPRACLGVDVEAGERDDGERPNQQIRLIGDVALVDDANGQWTTVVTDRYLNGPGAAERIKHRQRQNRTVIELRPIEIIAGASTPAQHS